MTITTAGVVPASRLVSASRPDWLDAWSRFAARTEYDDLPEAVVARAKLVVLDCVGAAVAGSAEPELRALAPRLPADRFVDAFLGGVAGTMLEIDEGNQYARGHPGIHVVPAVLAAAPGYGASGREALAAVVLGYEIGARIGIASKLRVTMHPHGTWGTVGAALAVGKLARGDEAQLAEAVNVASSLGLATSRRTMLEGGTVRNAYAGVSNMLGMMAWELTCAGFTGERDGVGSVYGGVAAEEWRPEEMTRDLGSRWEIARNYFKRHAACRYTHAALDALAAISREAGRLDPDSIASIDVATYVWAAQLDHPAPQNMLAAKFSLPFALATAILNGGATLDAFRDAARADPRVRELARRVSVREDPALTAMLPGLRPARVTIALRDGRSLRAEALTNKGDTEDPYEASEVVAKFHEVASPALGAARARDLARAVLELDAAARIDPIVALTRPC
jgi:2-methylcitrate dehydratase PrpD